MIIGAASGGVSGRRHLAAAEPRPAYAQLRLAIDEEPAGAIALGR